MSEVGEAHPEHHGQDVAHRDQDAHGHFVEFLHFQKAGDHIGLDGDDGHGDGVIQDDDAAFALGLHDLHPQGFDHHLAHPHFSHGPR